MKLNWTPEVSSYFLSSLICFIVFIIMISIVIKKRKLQLYYLSLSVFFMGVFYFLTSLSLLLLNKLVYILSAYTLYAAALFILFFIDYTLHETVSSKKLAVIGIIGTLLVISSLQPDAVVNFHGFGYPSLKGSVFFTFSAYFIMLFFLIVLMNWIIKTVLNAPEQLRSVVKLLLYGGIITLGAYFCWIVQNFIGVPIAAFFQITGVIFMMIAINKDQQILYILPFKTYRLVVIQKGTGIKVFSHLWEESNVEDILFAGLVSAVNQMGIEVVELGDLQHIVFECGILIFTQTEHLVFGLSVNKKSKLLNKCLIEFAREFQREFSKNLDSWDQDIEFFSDSMELVNKHFGYIPSRID